MIVPLLIDGKELLGSKSLVFNVESPFSEGAVLHQAQGATSEEIDQALTSSQEAFLKWRDVSFNKRREVLNKVGDILSERRETFVKLLTDIGQPQWFAEFNVEQGIGSAYEHASQVSSHKGVIPQANSCSYAMVIKEPIGTVLSIAPWNAPLVLGMRAIAGPVAAGCSVILKSSELSPLLHLELSKLFHEAGAPAGLVNVIHNSPETAVDVVSQLIYSRYVKKVTFTGSSAIGKSIATMCASVLKPALLELGGKCTSIVTISADLKKAVRALSFSAFGHNGQICMATDRVLVDESVYESFIEELRSWLSSSEAAVPILPQRTQAIAEKIYGMIKESLDSGAKIVHGENKREGAYLTPVVLEDVKAQDTIFNQETFGPVFYISKVRDVTDAIEKVNQSRYGLSVSIWIDDVLQGIEIARKIESGAVHINNGTLFDEPTVPHGGVKESGYGRFNSSWGLSEFQVSKTITIP